MKMYGPRSIPKRNEQMLSGNIYRLLSSHNDRVCVTYFAHDKERRAIVLTCANSHDCSCQLPGKMLIHIRDRVIWLIFSREGPHCTCRLRIRV